MILKFTCEKISTFDNEGHILEVVLYYLDTQKDF